MEDLKARFEAAGQGHVFAAWEELDPAQRRILIQDAECVPLDELSDLYQSARSRRT